MVYTRRGKSVRKRGSLRCKSADSGVSCTLNNRVLQQDVVQSSKYEYNGLEEEHLDFEPDIIDELPNDTRSSELLINSDQSSVKLSSGSYRDEETDSMSMVSIAHRRDMLPIIRSDAQDGRESEYLPSMHSSTVLLDSSSDNMSSNSNSIEDSNTDNFDSSAQDIDDNESLGMTQEEEDRLLDSSGGEESQNYIAEIDRSAVETCQIGNFTVTLPKFINNNVYTEELRCKDSKRTTTPTRLRQRKIKRRKWDLRYKPEFPLTRLFVDDIGYIPCNEEGIKVSDDSVVPQWKNLIVICNPNDKTMRVEPSNMDMGSNSGSFKMPLPPPKRPPTRPKRTIFNSAESGRNLQIQVSNKLPEGPVFSNRSDRLFRPSLHGELRLTAECSDKDDTISIIASSLGVDNVADIAELEEPSIDTSILTFDMNEPMRELPQPFVGFDYATERVKDWVEKVEHATVPKETIPLQISKPPIKAQLPVSPKGNPRVNFSKVPVVFLGLCYSYYLNGNCTRFNRCTLGHSVLKEKYTARFQHSNPADLMQAFQFALNYEKLFRDVYPCFIKTFGSLNMQTELVASVKCFLKSEIVDITEALDLVIKALESSGLPFLDAIERISFNVGFMEHPQLADILLELISRKSNIAKNWEVIKRIAKARGYIAPNIVTSILLRVTTNYPINKDLCVDIYNVLIKSNMTDSTQISENVLAPIRTITEFGEQYGGSMEQPIVSSRPIPLLPQQPAANPREILAAHIEGNLVKERERFEREVKSRTICTPVHPLSNSIVDDNQFIREGVYDFGVRKLSIDYSSVPQSMDTDERFFTPSYRKESTLAESASMSCSFNTTFLPAFSAARSIGSSGGGGRESCSSGSGPCEVTEYVPQKVPVRRDVSPNQQNLNPVIEPLLDLMEAPPQEEPTLTPLRPIFGRPNYREDFDFKKSLHNLLPDLEENVNINENDILATNCILKSKNGPEYYRLLQYYKGPTLGSFITMTIATLKASNDGVYETISGLLLSLARAKPNYAKDLLVKAAFEVITMNLLFILEIKGKWDEARRLLEWFCDWDSLVSSHLFQIFFQRGLTHMGRYIFLAKIFAKAKNFHLTYEILQCPGLHLLEHFSNWPISYNVQVDLERRNAVLAEFFKIGFHYNIVVVSDMYRRIYRYREIFGYKANNFNSMLVSIINEQSTYLKYFYPDIDIYYKFMDKNVLRAFTILMAQDLKQDEVFRLYEMCCERQIYNQYSGREVDITVRNNMVDTELQMILTYYFSKMAQSKHVPCNNVNVHIKLMERQVTYPKILQKCVRSIKEIKEQVMAILHDSFNIVAIDTPNSKDALVEINVEQVETWRENRRWLQDHYGNT